ncbi:uncharacterized protein MONOS_9424 [Monocercomonoides exilis]|uniref:uncharacterized protein n=1 Tax=Monocercomonoides exilis TaxID=2049356 RepID=UPI00355A5557|nr:hypothetical protein MONOS_9424 [Monocercomonoides exilis]|eukprot:MONOS_9424.1-p1 / transcript=MONOS_9424.1 / gene=MONOS_9424 / organism=Monocercomonoides_exilis_PA203 / gene_product=unspecified product / transcript_product=unspecified product / location=Mono_scaffold00389:7101-10278(+) / protein_length=736 / sequence_SO=supercontig / SO=protein_coding / is_pseudo=false
MQSIVLLNEGGASIDYRLDLTDMERLNASASDFPLFECPVTRGIVPAYGKQTIYWRFRPLMQRGYLVRIPIKLGSRYSSMSVMNANVGGGAGGGDGNVNGTNHSPSSNNGIGMGVGGAQGGAQGAGAGGSDGTEGITHMETVLQALLAGDGFIAKEGAEPLLCLLSHERVGFGSVAGGSIELRLVCLVCPRVRRHPALQKRAYEKGKKRGILFDKEDSHPLIKSQVVTIRPIRGEIAEGERCVCVVELHAPIAAQVVDTSLQCNIRKAIFTSSISNSSIANQNSSSSSSSINGVGASSEVNQIFSYHRFHLARRSSSVNVSSPSSSVVVASNFNSGSIHDHSIISSLSTQHSQLGKIKGLPSSSYPVPSQSSSSFSLAIAPHQPSTSKQPPRVSVIERITKSQGIQIATRLEQFRFVLEKARNEENQFLLALARQPVNPLSAAAASTLQSRTLASGIPLNETTKQALEIAAQAKEEQKIRILQKEKEREAFGMFKLIPTMSAMKGTPRENKGNLGPLRGSRSSSAGGRRMTDADEVSGVNVSLPPLLNPSSGSSSGLIPTGAMNKQGSAVRLPPLGMQDPNEGERGHEGWMSSKKGKFGGLDGLQDLDGDDLDGGMKGMLGEGDEDREWDDSFREPDRKIFLRMLFKSISAIRFSELKGSSSLLRRKSEEKKAAGDEKPSSSSSSSSAPAIDPSDASALEASYTSEGAMDHIERRLRIVVPDATGVYARHIPLSL